MSLFRYTTLTSFLKVCNVPYFRFRCPLGFGGARCEKRVEPFKPVYQRGRIGVMLFLLSLLSSSFLFLFTFYLFIF